MDYSYFPGAPKYNQGSRLGTLKWIFGLTERGRLDCILKQVPPSRTRKTLLPIINQHCLEGSLFCSDGWRAYHELAEHLDSEDVLHYPVNHSENYVYPETGAHTQTIQGLYSHIKDLRVRGMKPRDLTSYLGFFMWTRFCKQRNKYKFIHFLKTAAEVRPPSHFAKYSPTMTGFERFHEDNQSDDDFAKYMYEL